MDSEHKEQPRSSVQVLWQHARQSSARIPVKGWIAAGAFLIIGLALMVYSSSSKDSSLQFRFQHGFHAAQVSLWIDGDLTYSGKVLGAPRKRFGVIPDGTLLGTVSQVVPLSSGEHRVKIRVEPDDGNMLESVTTGDFARHEVRTLAVNAKRSGLSMSWSDEGSRVSASAPAAEPASGSSGIGHYASWLLLTVAGSIISALTGYAVRELPGIVRARQAADTKTTPTAN
jgi:hypothetical protein